MSKNKIRFISFEGGEGCGKSTQSKLLYQYMLSKGYNVILTREIGGTDASEKIRDIIVHTKLLPMSELMLVMAARFEHVNEVIIPALKQNIYVICDRFVDSTACYQGQYLEIGIKKVYDLHDEMLGQYFKFPVMPDITFFIDLPPHLALENTIGRKDNNKFEDKELSFHHKVHENFQLIAKYFPARIVPVKAQGLNITEVQQIILEKLFPFI